MPKIEANYPVSPRGLATSFTESEVPVEYALKFRNRFINAAGGAEKRPGMTQLGNTISGTPEITGLHELIEKDGTARLLSSGDGRVYRFDDVSAWPQVHSGLDAASVLRSVQMGDKQIFVNGTDRNFFTTDGSAFSELRAIIVRGAANTSASSQALDDNDVTDWVISVDVVENDIVFNITKNAFAVITAVTTANVAHTAIGSAATGLGQAIGDQEANDRYEVIDSVELNIIPTLGDLDNTATAGPGTGTTTVAVSGFSFIGTDIRVGDWVRNTTRTALMAVSAIATALTVTSVASQVAGDSLVFLKSAMPIATNAHVHFGRLYLVDARDESKIRISGANDPQDFTTDAATLDSNTFKFGELQPQGDTVESMASFQRFFAMGGRENLFLFEGTDPIADTSADTTSFAIIGLFPQGTVSPDGMVSIGNDLAFVTPDGVQTAALVGDASTLGRANISEAIKITLRELLKSTSSSEIIALHYPRRSWFMLKIGSTIFVFNYTAFFGSDLLSSRAAGTLTTQEGSWSLFDGNFARQRAYLIRRDSSLVCGGAGGKVYKFDNDTFDDDGEIYTTEYQSPWLSLSEPRKDVRIKDGKYIKPIFDTGAAVDYTITAEGAFDVESSETITVAVSGGGQAIGLATIPFVIGGSSIQNIKHSLRWRGEQVRITFTTEDNLGPDVISRFTLYANRFGRR